MNLNTIFYQNQIFPAEMLPILIFHYKMNL